MNVTEQVILHRQKAGKQGAKNTLILWVIIIGLLLLLAARKKL